MIIVTIVHNIFGTDYIQEEFESMDKEKVSQAEKEITKNVFSEVIIILLKISFLFLSMSS
jgi:hypothetical protein